MITANDPHHVLPASTPFLHSLEPEIRTATGSIPPTASIVQRIGGKRSIQPLTFQNQGYCGMVVVVVVAGACVTPPPLLLFDRIRMPSAMATPAPTHKSNGGLLSPCACFTPAAPPGARGPVSADIAGNGAMAIVALTSIEISALFTSDPLFWVFCCRYLPSAILTVN